MHRLVRSARFERAAIFALSLVGAALPVSGATAQRLTDAQIPTATNSQLILSARDAQIDLSCMHFQKIIKELNRRLHGGTLRDFVRGTRPTDVPLFFDVSTLQRLQEEGCPKRPAPQQPSIEVGFAAGGTFFGNGNGFARGIDSFNNIIRVDQEPLNFGGSSITFGGFATFYTPPVTTVGQMPVGLFARFGLMGSTNNAISASFANLNDVPRVAGTATVTRGLSGLFAIGGNFSVYRDVSVQVGVAAVVTKYKFDAQLLDIGAGVFAQRYGGTEEHVSFEPALVAGFRVAVPNVPNLKVGGDMVWSGATRMTKDFQSPTFASEKVAVSTGGGSNVTAMAGLYWELGGGQTFRLDR